MFALFPSRAVAVVIFGFPVHWYGILYLLAFLNAGWMLPRIQKYRGLSLTRDAWLSVLSAGILGVIVGGRLGFVFLYEPQYFLANPLKIFAVWEGGMSSHGGFLGVAVALFVQHRLKHIPPRAIADLAAVPAAIGLALGRIGNFMNQELYGTVTNLPWAMNVPGVEGLRHPLQIYDALLSLLIALVCYFHLRNPKSIPGRTFAIFLMLYGVMRFFVEFIREQQYPLMNIAGFLFTRGQILTLPVFLIGVICYCTCKNKK
jgi:phosphatidylglycerol:prolipoprotein diacylglycerol transferase